VTTKSLVDELVQAVNAYARRIPGGEVSIVWWISLWTGLDRALPRVGKVPPPPPGEPDNRTYGDVHGHHTLDQVAAWLHELVDDLRMWEPWLVRSLVDGIDRELDQMVEGYGAAAARRREDADWLERYRADPEFRAAVDKRVVDAGGGPAPVNDTFVGLIAKLREPASLTELRDRRVARDAWRAVTGDIVSDASLKDWLDEKVRNTPPPSV
jgi:hypothetical protein